MKEKDAHILSPQSLLELALSFGHEEDQERNYANFLKTLCELLELSYASIWIRNEEGNQALLLASYPSTETKVFRRSMPNLSTSWTFLQETEKEEADGDKSTSKETALFSIPGTGFLSLEKINRGGAFRLDELEQLKPVLKNFGQLLKADISHQRYKNESFEKAFYATRLQSMIDYALDGFIIINADAEILEWNPRATEILGWSKEEVLGRKMDDFINPINYCDIHVRVINNFLREIDSVAEKQELELETKNKHGKHRSLILNFVRVETQTLPIYYGYIRDITQQRIEEDRQNELLEKLEEANKELKDFAHVVSHDLKAPLRSIKMLSDWIGEDYADELGEEGKEQFELLKSKVDHMKDLINGILEYSQMGRRNSEEKVVNLDKLLEGMIDILAPPEHIEINIACGLPHIRINEVSIGQVFQNLLSNAIKYMDKEEGKIEIGFKESRNRLTFWLKDNGPGIDKKDFQKVFRIFETLGNKSFESTGVGLAIVKKILSNYNGKIWLESESGQGTTFYFSLPKSRRVHPDRLAKLSS
ncbi:MAG: ATP-binding protein [Bacteroidota bacterium]